LSRIRRLKEWNGFSDNDNGKSYGGWNRSDLPGGAPLSTDSPHYDGVFDETAWSLGLWVAGPRLTTIIWIESVIKSFFSNATIKFVGETRDWKPVGAVVVRLILKFSIMAMVLVRLLAAPISLLLNEPDLAFYLRVCAVDIPILCLGQAFRNVLIGTGNYQGSAIARAGRCWVRMCLVVVFAEAGLTITGALLDVIGASVVELWLCRWYLGSGMFINSPGAPIPIQRYGALLVLSSLCLIFYNGMDLFMLKILGGTATQAGIYSAAQSSLASSRVVFLDIFVVASNHIEPPICRSPRETTQGTYS
jgi:hypothetical protein